MTFSHDDAERNTKPLTFAGDGVLFAYDYSGSTGGQQLYHDLAQLVHQSISDTHAGTIPYTILAWDSHARIWSPDELARVNRLREGSGGTNPEVVASLIRQNNFHGHLSLFTDGQVGNSEVEACSRVLGPDWKFESVTVHLVSTGSVRCNMSVSCPFTRVSPHEVHSYNSIGGTQPVSTSRVSAEDLQVAEDMSVISTLDEFRTMLPMLKRAVIAKCMGVRGGLPDLRAQLLAIKRRITREQAMNPACSEAAVALTAALDGACGGSAGASAGEGAEASASAGGEGAETSACMPPPPPPCKSIAPTAQRLCHVRRSGAHR